MAHTYFPNLSQSSKMTRYLRNFQNLLTNSRPYSAAAAPDACGEAAAGAGGKVT